MFRASLRQLLTAPPSIIHDVYHIDVGPGFDVVGEAGTGEETTAVVRSARPDILLLDLSMPRMSGLGALRELQTSGDSVRTIILAGSVSRPHLLSAVQLRVDGFVLKDEPTEIFFKAIMCVLAGQPWVGQHLVADLLEIVRSATRADGTASKVPYGLTPRERQVLALVAAGHPNKEIARTCAVSEETIKHHLTRMFDKLGASNRLELAMVATAAGLISES